MVPQPEDERPDEFFHDAYEAFETYSYDDMPVEDGGDNEEDLVTDDEEDTDTAGPSVTEDPVKNRPGRKREGMLFGMRESPK